MEMLIIVMGMVPSLECTGLFINLILCLNVRIVKCTGMEPMHLCRPCYMVSG